MLHVDIMTLMPQAWTSLDCGVVHRALTKGLWHKRLWQIHNFSARNDHRIDDRPFGGGPGMIMQADPLALCWQSICKQSPQKPFLIQMDPCGQPLNQTILQELSQKNHLSILCGRYEGIDQRFTDTHVDLCLSVGPFVLSGGDLPAMLLVDGLIRLLPDVLGNPDSGLYESHQNFLLEHAQYTRPQSSPMGKVPSVLTSGHDQKIRRWQRTSQLLRTLEFNPQYLQGLNLSHEDIESLMDAFSAHHQAPKPTTPSS